MPTNDAETVFNVFMMTFMGLFWAHVLGVFCTLIQFDPHMVESQRNLDDLNDMCKTWNRPQELRMRLRSYLYQSAEQARADSYRHLMQRMSPGLAGDIRCIRCR